jgi:hypothetical protein
MKKVYLITLISLLIVTGLIIVFILNRAVKTINKSKTNESENKAYKNINQNPISEAGLGSVMIDLREIMGVDSSTHQDSFLWNTNNGEIEISGTGFLYQGSTDKKSIANLKKSVITFLENSGYKSSQFNSDKSDSIRLVKDNVACLIRLIESDSSYDLEVLCAELEPSVEQKMTLNEAIKLAENPESACMIEGNLKNKDKAFYNNNSKTWWIDLVSEKEGCSPACVIFADKKIEINWRCTGLISN